ncbi:hypothetical protein AYR46_19980 [Sphingobium yanoikuyae]|uniref:cysteine desulfurase family protein n=1 Tax=Sphingobium yanoikuyae TaxID=13690 RepID=UPI0007A9F144|nr:cysteine desulfurase family protein [Sphingobium yanoikuyae]KZC76065.1 hypothetical protein AYR46_19980 [Sphingobium yanoikuyae]
MVERVASSLPPIYLDHHASTPVDPRVIEAMCEAMRTLPANPNSVEHGQGRQAAAAIAVARVEVAGLIGCEADDVHFTGSASDAIRKALELAIAERGELRIAAMPVEHPAMIHALRGLERQGLASVHWLEVDGRAQLCRESLDAALRRGLDLVCLMAGNNEVGTIYPVAEVFGECLERDVLTLVDATQAAGRVDLHPIAPLADYLILSGHKIYGPKGIGALVAPRSGRHLHEVFAQSGTPNVPAIVGLGAACRIAHEERAAECAHAQRLRDRLEAGLHASLDHLVVNGDVQNRLPHSLHVAIPGVANDAILARVGHQLALSTGAACASGAQEPSHVLRAMALPDAMLDTVLRLSVGRFTTEQDVDHAVQILVGAARAILSPRQESQLC